MVTALDVAAYILQQRGSMSAMKLQKLVYYSQAWSLVWDDAPLFGDHIEAWANGPVVPTLYNAHRGMFKVAAGDIPGKPDALDKDQKQTVDVVLKYYGDKSPQWLSDLTHSEAPWKDARKGLDPGERGDEVIRTAAMAEYYGSL
jgi:uncharacterized phage-associated protein